MGASFYLKDLLLVAPILGLFVVGLAITLKSGVVSLDRDRGKRILGNLSHLAVALAGCLAFLLMVQQIVGFRIDSRW